MGRSVEFKLPVVLLPIWVTATLAPLSLPAIAQDYPTIGVLYGRADGDFISFECRPSRASTIDCKFTQIKARKKALPKDLSAELSRTTEIERDFRDGKAKAACEQAATFQSALKSGQVPSGVNKAEYQAAIGAMASKEKQDLLETLGAVTRVCAAPTRENIADMLRAEHDKKSRSCALFANPFEQSFQRNAGGAWVHNAGPTGVCGVIYITRFERDPDPKNSTLWNYTTRKVVTHKQGTALLMSCGDFDETEYFYSWKLQEVYKGCDYLSYGP